jgi:hypothetical protein
MASVFRGQLALGTKLSGEGIAARLIHALGALIALGFAIFAARVARRDGATSLADAVALSSTALAWVAGLLFVLGAATQGMARDRGRGVSALYRLHGVSRQRYLVVRALGLGLQLLRMVALGSLFVALVGAAAAPRTAQVLAAARGWASCLVYALAFALVVAPLAAAAGGSPSAEEQASSSASRWRPADRPRGRGLVVLGLVLLLPAIVRLATAGVVDPSWRAVLGIPSALSALRALVLGAGDRPLALHAAVVLLLMAALGAALLRAQMTRRRGATEDGAW